MTASVSAEEAPEMVAATEPAHFERDDDHRPAAAAQLQPERAATEPAHFERDDDHRPAAAAQLQPERAATEPAHFERDDSGPARTPRTTPACRNAARSF